MIVSTGASATIGIALAASTTGIVSSAISRDDAASTASTSPMRKPATRPTSALPPVTAAVDRITGNWATNCCAMASGVGSRNAGTAKATTTTCHTTRMRTPSATGASTPPPRRGAAVASDGPVTRAPCATPRAPR